MLGSLHLHISSRRALHHLSTCWVPAAKSIYALSTQQADRYLKVQLLPALAALALASASASLSGTQAAAWATLS